MGKKILGVFIVLGPVGIYVASATSPQTAGAAGKIALVGLIACVVAAMFKRRGAVAGAVLLLIAAVIVPKCLWMLRLGRCGMNELAVARARVESFRREHGRPPAGLEELGPLPPLHVWTADDRDRDHFHPATGRVSILRSGIAPPDDGGWGYDPEQGRVFISCTGLEPKLRRTPLYEL